MRGRTVLFVVLAVVLALGGVYIGWSTSSPKAAAEPATATPPTRRWDPPRQAGSGPVTLARTAAPKGSADKGSTAKGTGTESSAPRTTPPSRYTSPSQHLACHRFAAAAPDRPGARSAR